ncbi:hypothetical protein [Tepidibacter formicigenes]|jgi:hypothetical protein|uniref:Uncharacterized protein n=1 Tax=Tepidibacter formicigenes DSM 15518 TaxID=1123349 RepID=A0A1M6RKK6_9FIRM|nr:hypothetical protein [Tepidibacter formicigenes]SHK32972.1 hypothetical protein SAMN02744037_02135 [Tepidibacter formicigenes DSM 15518]
MMNIKQKIIDMILVAVVSFGTFAGLTNLASRMFMDVKEYVPYALTVVTLFFIKECYQIIKEEPVKIN